MTATIEETKQEIRPGNHASRRLAHLTGRRIFNMYHVKKRTPEYIARKLGLDLESVKTFIKSIKVKK